MKYATFLATAFSLVSSSLATTQSIVIEGNAMWQGSTRWYIRGVDYQPGGSSTPEDPIANPETCKRDLPMFKKLGINTVRVYSVDNTKDHDFCMNLFAQNGIYVAVDVNNSKYSLNRADPAPSYNNVYLANIFATMDMFSQYANTLLFFSGNEVINNYTNTNCAPYVKAVTRDMRNYIKARGMRAIPVGYAAADVVQNRYQMATYMNCGPEEVRSDFFSFNDYEWCDPSTFVKSGWDTVEQMFSNFSIPLFLSEYGCITNPPRTFGETAALYSTKMCPVYSGGLVYEYTEEPDNPGYGLVNVISQTEVTERNPDFTNYMNKLHSSVDPPGPCGYKKDLPPSTCPGYSNEWQVHGDELPAIPVPALAYMKNGPPAGSAKGLNGPGSQYAGTPSRTTLPANGGGQGGSTSSSAANPHLKPGKFSFGPIGTGVAVLLSALVGASLL